MFCRTVLYTCAVLTVVISAYGDDNVSDSVMDQKHFLNVHPQSGRWALNYRGHLYTATFNEKTDVAIWTVRKKFVVIVKCPSYGNTVNDFLEANCSTIGSVFGSSLTIRKPLSEEFNESQVMFKTAKHSWQDVMSVFECGNVSVPGVKQDVPLRKGYRDRHTFSCSSKYQSSNETAVCQANLSWDLTLTCKKVARTSYEDMYTILILVGLTVFELILIALVYKYPQGWVKK